MPDPTNPHDPFAGLERLAPTVDVEGATSSFARARTRRARRRRAAVTGLAGVALLGALGVGLALTGDGGRPEEIVAGPGPDPSPTESVIRPVDPGDGRRVVSVVEDGIRLEMTLPEQATVGERLWLDVTLTNERTGPITVGEAAPCQEPFLAIAGKIEAINAVEAATEKVPYGPESFGLEYPWSGELSGLGPVLASVEPPKVLVGRAENQLPTLSVGCTLEAYPPQPVEPSGSIRRRIAIDLRWSDPTRRDGGTFDVRVTTGVIRIVDGRRVGSMPLRHPIDLVDPVDRAPSHAAAIGPGGMTAAPTLQEWLDALPNLVGSEEYLVSLTWWQGAWETWIRPTSLAPNTLSGPPTLRIRFDPERMEVVDVREVFGNAAPSDDPDAYPDGPEQPVDEVRYSAD